LTPAAWNVITGDPNALVATTYDGA